MKELEIILFSIFSSTISPILGIGGGLMNVPFLTIYVGAGFAAATTASLLSGFCMSVSASIHNFRKGEVQLPSSLRLLPPILAGSLLSAFIPFHENWLYLFFALFASAIAYYMLSGAKPQVRTKNPAASALLLFGIGVLSGLLGIGGGILLVPFLMFAGGLGIKRAIATTNFMTIFIMLAGFSSHWFHNDFDASIAIPLALPALLMGYVGAYIMVEKIKKETLRKIIAVFLMLVALAMALKSFSG